MTWNNPTTNLWYVTTPTPGVIVFDGTHYFLTMPGISMSYKFQSPNLFAAQTEYVTQATSLLATTVTLIPNLPSLSAPADQQTVAFIISGSPDQLGAGVYTAATGNITVTAATVPLSTVTTWSPLP
jgi:hypothetical protein